MALIEGECSHLSLIGTSCKITFITHLVVIAEFIRRGDETALTKSFIKPELINEYVDGEDSLLMKAVMECHPTLVRIVLEKGANPNVPSKNSKTPLIMAVELVIFCSFITHFLS